MMSNNLPEPLPTPEFSRPVNVEGVKIGKSEQTIEATADECRKLAERFNLLALDDLSARIRTIRKGQGEAIRISVSGHLQAKVTQSCIITLEPVESEIGVDFRTVFDSDVNDRIADCDLDPEQEDVPEPIVDGIVDLGELMAQVLAVEINPFPRKDGANSSEMTLESSDSGANPFAILEKLKSNPK